jgi:hypothetical protein
VHSGGEANDLLPAYLAVALLAGLTLSDRPGGLLSGGADRLARNRIAGWRPGQAGRWVAAAAAALTVAQLAVLVNGFHPGRAIPADADRAAGSRLVAGIRAVGGTVAVPADPGLALLAGLPAAVAHQGAADDVLRASGAAGRADFISSAARAVAARRFSVIITESTGPPDGFPRDLTRYYHRCPRPLLAGVPPAVFRRVAGPPGRPAYIWLPTGASCATVLALHGAAAPGPAGLAAQVAHPRRLPWRGAASGGTRAGGPGRSVRSVCRSGAARSAAPG